MREELKYFTCYYCKKLKPILAIKKGSLVKSTAKGKCKPCHVIACRKYRKPKASKPRGPYFAVIQ